MFHFCVYMILQNQTEFGETKFISEICDTKLCLGSAAEKLKKTIKNRLRALGVTVLLGDLPRQNWCFPPVHKPHFVILQDVCMASIEASMVKIGEKGRKSPRAKGKTPNFLTSADYQLATPTLLNPNNPRCHTGCLPSLQHL
ncbi:hypothetical protein AAMO2058_000239600 [Amorphochlora amoebiformis]